MSTTTEGQTSAATEGALIEQIKALTEGIKGALAAATDPAAIEAAVTKALGAHTGEASLAQKALAEQASAHADDEAAKAGPSVWIKGLDERPSRNPEYTKKALDVLFHSATETDTRAESADRFKKLADEFHFARTVMDAQALGRGERNGVDFTKMASWHRLQEARAECEKAYTLTSGADWIPEQFSDQLLPLIFLPRQLAGLLVPIDMPSAEYRIPVDQALSILPYATALGPVGSGDDRARVKAAAAGAGKSTLSAKGMSLRSVVDRLASESSIIAAMPTIMMQLSRALTWGMEEMIVNGDTGAGVAGAQDTATPADCRTLFDGWRQYAIANSTAFDVGGTGKFKPASLGTLRSKLSRELLGDPSRLVIVFSTDADNISMTSADWLLFQASYSTNAAEATALNGPSRQYNGSPKVTTVALKGDMTVAGLWTTAGTQGNEVGNGATSGILQFHRDCWALGRVGGPTGEVVRDAETDSYALVVHQYVALQNLRTNYKSVSYGYNVIA